MDNTDMVNPRATSNARKRVPRFKNANSSIRRNAPERINDGYFNGLLSSRQRQN
ncbi:hypothetical protein PQR05_24505 [Paraburkholderia sediminicola]|uniref:hypothetical protein n=1 Tax=Paraburkholderia sediminicola TaxID=458836 RepID=UPI0038BCB35A